MDLLVTRGDPEPPSSPLSLAVEEVRENSFTLTWKAPEHTGKAGLDGYLVEICKDGSSEWKAVNQEPFLSTRYTIPNLSSGDKVHVRVTAAVNDPLGWCPKDGGNSGTQAVVLQGTRTAQETGGKRWMRFLGGSLVAKEGICGVGRVGWDVIPLCFPWCPELPFWSPELPKIRMPRHLRETYVRHVGDAVNIMIPFQVGFNVALEWSPPADNGNAEIKGYRVQKSDKKSGKWFTVLERCTRTSCTISDLIIGNSYSFRVFSENSCGLSNSAAVTAGLAHIEKTKTTYQPEKIPQREMMEPPKFTQPLTDRTTTRGYNTHLFCSVRGFPQPKIIWLKNQMEIREDPKYIALIDQGVCSLEIRKPGPFDGGVYTCKAINALGEASVDCRLDVKVPK
ncbi:myosin-binding protein H [Manacus vitellinus]|uniref:myosin-binding protein H n=1 Tax=Manacus vitellinus TaxID=328815 RepID=UPI00115F672D|nr:myosin-binding protein H [Manacus vitellinus]